MNIFIIVITFIIIYYHYHYAMYVICFDDDVDVFKEYIEKNIFPQVFYKNIRIEECIRMFL